ncbi:unnamed protein product [Anisakis simplex]|uniref:Kunitz/Bovine pancreatic trypsin inhibitor domain protein n=1 Tax=Anisakis simplex TaxID=6269 RepID=A0A0M3J5V9_ANISI|nr:unnamed protein product [Anisakis simplex]
MMQLVDPCTQDRDPGVGSAKLPRYTFNKLARVCEPFTYYGSAGNRNNFQSLQDCQNRCPESPNPCPHAPLNPQTPCNGNSGSCGSNQYCHNGQSPSTSVCCNKLSGERCNQPVVSGVGNANLVRWYYNAFTQQCQQFIYNGLQGNENNFLTREQCEDACFANPCLRGTPFQSQGVTVQCSMMNQAVCPAGYYCHIGANSQTSVCCQALGK